MLLLLLLHRSTLNRRETRTAVLCTTARGVIRRMYILSVYVYRINHRLIQSQLDILFVYYLKVSPLSRYYYSQRTEWLSGLSIINEHIYIQQRHTENIRDREGTLL